MVFNVFSDTFLLNFHYNFMKQVALIILLPFHNKKKKLSLRETTNILEAVKRRHMVKRDNLLSSILYYIQIYEINWG